MTPVLFSSAVALASLLEINGQHSLKDRVNRVPFSVVSQHEMLGSTELTELTAASLLSLFFSPVDPRWSSYGFFLKISWNKQSNTEEDIFPVYTQEEYSRLRVLFSERNLNTVLASCLFTAATQDRSP